MDNGVTTEDGQQHDPVLLWERNYWAGMAFLYANAKVLGDEQEGDPDNFSRFKKF